MLNNFFHDFESLWHSHIWIWFYFHANISFFPFIPSFFLRFIFLNNSFPHIHVVNMEYVFLIWVNEIFLRFLRRKGMKKKTNKCFICSECFINLKLNYAWWKKKVYSKNVIHFTYDWSIHHYDLKCCNICINELETERINATLRGMWYIWNENRNISIIFEWMKVLQILNKSNIYQKNTSEIEL